MAQLTTGYSWLSGNTVTPALLNQTVNSATITDIQAADIGDSQISTAKIADGAVTGAKVASTFDISSKTVVLPANVATPAGAVMAFAMNSAPSGWLEANGAAVSRSTYAALFSAIGITHGAGNGSTTFNLPDLRGIFVRGSGAQTISGTSYSKTFAAKEGDAFQGHIHSVASSNALATSAGTGVLGGPDATFFGATITIGAAATDGTNGTPRTASETRPANIALLYCIKF